MHKKDFSFKDTNRNRDIPTLLCLPDDSYSDVPLVIFSPGYQDQEELSMQNAEFYNKGYKYLAEFFTSKGFAFISIQHDIPGDKDGLETLDHNKPQASERRHLWERGVENILCVIQELEIIFPELNFNQFIIAGHSNGGDIAKFFANQYPEKVSHIIALDARRCPIDSDKNLKLLMFEAEDTSTDIGVIPEENNRNKLEWMIIKPKGAKHISYLDKNINDYIKSYVLRHIEFFIAEGEYKQIT